MLLLFKWNMIRPHERTSWRLRWKRYMLTENECRTFFVYKFIKVASCKLLRQSAVWPNIFFIEFIKGNRHIRFLRVRKKNVLFCIHYTWKGKEMNVGHKEHCCCSNFPNKSHQLSVFCQTYLWCYCVRASVASKREREQKKLKFAQ